MSSEREPPARAQHPDTGRDRPAIRARDLSKMYRIYRKPAQRLMDLLHLPGGPRHKEFWALRGVNLEVGRGNTLGIIGENGAGKSTLLKLLTGITLPSEGQVEVQGRVSSLLELGAGFHPELSGRENIRLNCSVLGMSEQEITERTPRIEEFSELGDFLERPVKTYSSGMYVRLGFAVAASVDPDVLFIDEALSVGDEHFRGKCLNRLNQFREDGRTVIFVSHEIGTVKAMCQRVLLLHAGQVLAQGSAEEVADEYLRRAHARGNERLGGFERRTDAYPRWGSGEVLVTEVQLLGPDGSPTHVLQPGQPFTVRMRYESLRGCGNPVFGLGLYAVDGTYVNGSNHHWRAQPIELRAMPPGEKGTVEMSGDRLPLLAGDYYLTAFLYDHAKAAPMPLDHREHVLAFEVVDVERRQHGLLELQSRWRVERDQGRGPVLESEA